MRFRYVYGPVPSRRLGRSLGVNPIPYKTCNYSCVYCQLGRTSRMTNTRRAFFPSEEIAAEIRLVLKSRASRADYVTFVGEGEPTLCRGLGDLIARTKEMTTLPVAVITNGSLLYRREVRQELARADLVMPSLDAADQQTFQRVSRPFRALRIERLIEGMIRFRQRYTGKLWIEVMLVQGLNDLEEPLLQIRRVLAQVAPDRVCVNVPIRPPAEAWVRPPDAEGLARAHRIIGDVVLVDQPEVGEFSTAGFDDPVEAVSVMVRRHPMRLEQIQETLSGFPPAAIASALEELENTGKLQKVNYQGTTYFACGSGRFAGRARR
ncbi:MAG: radical SAM protein [Candidatus Latescibacterota bacterium]